MRLFLPFLLFGAAASQTRISPSRISTSNITFAPGDIIFQDEFNFFNRELWHHEINMNGGGNNEFQIYDDYDENAFVRDGIMYIKPTLSLNTVFGGNQEELYDGFLNLEGCTAEIGSSACERQGVFPNILPPAVSTRIRTAGSFSFTYGKVEIRAKMPAGDWVWPAITMLPEHWQYGGWPLSGEFDIAVTRGNRNLYSPSGVNIGSEQAGQTLHFGPSGYNGWLMAHGERNTAFNQGYDRDFHLYEVEWTPDFIKLSIDGDELKTIRPEDGGFFEVGEFPSDVENPWNNADNFKMAPFDQSFHFILNVAVGGGFFPEDSSPAHPWGSETTFLDFYQARNSWENTWGGDQAAMAVDYIRVYAV